MHTRRSIHSNNCEIHSQASAWNALDVIDDFVDRDLEKLSAHYYQRKSLNDGIPDSCLKIIQGVRVGKRIQKIKERFIQTELSTSDFVPCFLESKMHMWPAEVFLDGTFSLTRSTEFSQVYIVSHLFINNHKTLSHPLIFIMMRNKKKIFNDDILTFLKDQYFLKFQAELSPHMFHLDCELATILFKKNNFPDSPITLCGVHILRNMLKN